jgi:5'-nucleotidase
MERGVVQHHRHGRLEPRAACRSREPGLVTGELLEDGLERGHARQSYPAAGYPALRLSWILLTNDDGVDSPSLIPLARALGALGTVRVVVPDRERSWIGKAITRWEEVPVSRCERDGLEMFVTGGYPADCGNLGIHSLFDSPPALLVSGVNLGLNTGLGFFFSSGTVGAAMEAWIAGIPALAFSTGRAGNDRDWKRGAREPSMKAVWHRAADLAAEITRAVRLEPLPDGVDLLNINFPLEADANTERSITRVAPQSYAALFRRTESGGYVHDVVGLASHDAALAGTDLAAVSAGRVSITPVRLGREAPLSSALRRRLLGNRPSRRPTSIDTTPGMK